MLFKTIKKTPEQQVADAICERGITVKIGNKNFHMKPITLSQLVDFSAIASTLDELTIAGNDYVSKYNEVFKNKENAQALVDAAIVALFRYDKDRDENREYITKNITLEEFRPIFNFILQSIDPDFFLQVIISLKGMNQTRPTRTTMTALSQ